MHTGGTVTALTPNLVVITWLDCGITYVKAKPFAHPNALPRLSTERLRTDLLRIFNHTESEDTATDESDEQDSLSSDSSDDSGSSPDRNNTLLESNNSSPPRERDLN